MDQFHMPQNSNAPQGFSATWNTNVLKEPRGMIRIIQLIFAILAFTTTINFDTTTSFTISCYNNSDSDIHWQRTSTYLVEYPFDFSNTTLKYLNTCIQDDITDQQFLIDFSSSAKFFVFTGILAFLYTVAAEFVYIAQWQRYENNQFFALADFGGTSLLAIFWFAGAFAWAFSVSDVKYYAGPLHLIAQLPNCNRSVGGFTYNCFAESPGKWSSLYISLIFGFANLFLWTSSLWFVYKETIFHRRTLHAQPLYPNIACCPAPGTAFGEPGMFYDQHAEPTVDQISYPQAPDLRMNNVAHNPTYMNFNQGRQ